MPKRWKYVHNNGNYAKLIVNWFRTVNISFQGLHKELRAQEKEDNP